MTIAAQPTTKAIAASRRSRPGPIRAITRMPGSERNSSARIIALPGPRSDARRGPVPLGGGAFEAAQRRDLCREGAHGLGHFAATAKEPIDLAAVNRQARDLSLELVGDIRV